jgi:hypothetical protein
MMARIRMTCISCTGGWAVEDLARVIIGWCVLGEFVVVDWVAV